MPWKLPNPEKLKEDSPEEHHGACSAI
jgi:hypothetical protein